MNLRNVSIYFFANSCGRYLVACQLVQMSVPFTISIIIIIQNTIIIITIIHLTPIFIVIINFIRTATVYFLIVLIILFFILSAMPGITLSIGLGSLNLKRKSTLITIVWIIILHLERTESFPYSQIPNWIVNFRMLQIF